MQFHLINGSVEFHMHLQECALVQCLKCYNLINEINALEIYLNGNLNCYKWKTDKGLGKNAVFLINLKIIEGKNVAERSAMLPGCD